MKKVLFIYTDWAASEARKKVNGYGGVSYYRIVQPARALAALGWEVTVVGKDLVDRFGKTPEEIWPAVFSQFDAVVVKQMDNAQAAGPFFFFADKYNTPVIIDLDDNYFAVKDDQPAWQHYKPGSQKRAILAATLSLADAMFVSTEPLRVSYQKFLKDVYQQDTPIWVLPNCNVLGDWPAIPKREHGDKITIGYAGSITHNADLELVMPAIINTLKKHPNVHFEVFGALGADDARKMFGSAPDDVLDRMTATGAEHHSWDGYPPALLRKPWDIGIAPLVDDEFTRGKSHIKWMEYTMAGLPVVASPTYPYIERVYGIPAIEDGVTGFFARSTEEWEMVLSRLIEDAELRRTISTNAYAAIKDRWQYADHAFRWADALTDVICNFQTRRTKMALSKTAKTPAD